MYTEIDDYEIPASEDIEPTAPTRSCANCQHWFSTKWYRSIGDGLTGYCDKANQNRHGSQVCPGHEWLDEF